MKEAMKKWNEQAQAFYSKHRVALHKLFTILVVTLVVLWPASTANVFAQIRTIENHGEAGVEGFLDASGDVWTLGVTVDGAQSVNPSSVTVNGFPFNTCVPGVSGVECFYTFDFRDSSIFATEYNVNIDAGSFGSTLTSVIAEYQPPIISGLQARQQGSDVSVSFSVGDLPDKCVGLKSVKILDNNNQLLESFEGADLEALVRDCEQGDISVIVPSGRTGTTTFSAKIVAEDKLGHVSTVYSNAVHFDLTTPDVIPGSFFIGAHENTVSRGTQNIPISVEVVEDGTFLEATISSTDASVTQTSVDCSLTPEGTFLCEWLVDAEFIDSGSYDFLIQTRDAGSNTRTVTLSQDLDVDGTAPNLVSFGTKGQYTGINYVAEKNNTVIAEFTEAGSGIDPSTVIADLTALNRFRPPREAANRCEQTRSRVLCYWDGIDVNQGGEIFLLEAKDNVGNRASLIGVSADVELDTTPPRIGEVTVTGVRQGAATPFIQSRDSLVIDFTINETKGASASVDVFDVVRSGATTLDANCQEDASIWTCRVVTQAIKSGPDLRAKLIIQAKDTAGNIAREEVTISILGVDGDTDNPDFWAVTRIESSPDGIDSDIVKLAPQRMFFTLPLTKKGSVEILGTELLGCTPDPRLSRPPRIINNAQGSTRPIIVLEVFQPQEQAGNSLTGFQVLDQGQDLSPVSVNCTIGISTRRGNEVIQESEQETVELEAKFFQTPLSASLAQLDKKIDRVEDRIDSGFFGLIGTLEEIMQWIRVICQFLTVVQNLLIIVDAVEAGSMQALYSSTFGTAAGIASCNALQGSMAGVETIVDELQELCLLASCNPQPVQSNWYGRWQETVLNFYNIGTGKALLLGYKGAQKATALTDNLVLSVIGLCLPGVIKNLNKMRQIDCVYLDCLQTSVAQGTATMEACREIRDYMECKYVWGEVFQFLPLVGAVDQLLGILKSLITDPIGVARFVLVWACALICPVGPAGTAICNAVSILIFLLDTVNTIISGINQIDVNTEGDYCARVT